MIARAEDVTEERANLWQFLSDYTSMGRRYKKLFVYVPQGLEDKAQNILENNNVDYDGLRSYAIIDGWLKVSPIKTHNDPYDHR